MLAFRLSPVGRPVALKLSVPTLSFAVKARDTLSAMRSQGLVGEKPWVPVGEVGREGKRRR